MRQKIISLFFISLFLFSLVGVSFHFIILQSIIKTEIYKAIKQKSFASNDIKVFRYNEIKNNIYWHEKNKEFSYNHKMYDILNVSKINNSLYIYALEDTKEEAIIFDFLKKSNNKNHQNLLHNFLQNFIFEVMENTIAYFTFSEQCYFKSINLHYKNIYIKLPTPPPNKIHSCLFQFIYLLIN